MINYFNFKRLSHDRYLLANDFGNYEIVDENILNCMLNGQIDEIENKSDLIKDGFIIEKPYEKFIKMYSPMIKSMKGYCLNSTALHIFAVTNACNFNCIYCQAHDDCSKQNGFMTNEIGEKAIDFALQSANKNLTFEFQGGEPLMNFDVIKHMILYLESLEHDKNIELTIVTNFTLLDDDKLDFLLEHGVKLCTSLDGNEIIHNHNRPYKNGKGTYIDVVNRIKELKTKGLLFGAIQTTSNFTLYYPIEIINQYRELGFNTIFLRPLTPLGMADKFWDEVGYDPEQFVLFYNKAFDYIMELNLKGEIFVEMHATYFLKKILCNYSDNYMELRSPCGAGIGQMSYYYDGNVYTCDEGRMLSEMGDNSFLVGNVLNDNHFNAVQSKICKATCQASIVECLPGCQDCVYHPYCGVCPVVNYANSKDLYGKIIKDFRCKVYRGILDKIFTILTSEDEDKIKVLYNWMEL